MLRKRRGLFDNLYIGVSVNWFIVCFIIFFVVMLCLVLVLVENLGLGVW